MAFYKDRRLFRRYKQKTDFYVIVEGNYYKAATVDFSLSGLCIFIEGRPSLEINAPFNVKIEELDLDIQGRIVWLQETDHNLLVGVEKMAIDGLLRIYPLSDILLDLQRSDATGTLEVEQDPVVKSIYIKNGVMIFAASNQQEDNLGELLLKTGKITNDQYYQSVAVLKSTGNRLGTVLVKLGHLKPDELVRAVRFQAEEIILSLFTWENGRVKFVFGPLPEDVIPFKLSAANLIFQGIKRINKPEYFKNICPPQDTILYFSSEPMNLFQDINLTEDDRYVLALLDTKLTLKEVFDISSLGRFKTTKIISALHSIRMIEKKGEKILDDQSIVRIIKEPQTEVDSAFLSKVEDLYDKYESMDYYSILGIERSSTKEQIRQAYYILAKEYHPDKHIKTSSGTLKSRLNVIFAYITEAYKTLTDQKLKAQYDRNLSVKRTPSKAENKAETARKKFREGRDALRSGQLNEAVELLGQAAYLDSSVADYHYSLGVAYRKLRRFHDAQKSLVKAIELNASNGEFYAEVGIIYGELGFPLRAKSSFERALKLDPSNKKASEGLKQIETKISK